MAVMAQVASLKLNCATKVRCNSCNHKLGNGLLVSYETIFN